MAIDTSGSIGQQVLDNFFGYLSTLCNQVCPESVTVLWWDSKVQSKQVFTDNYDNLKDILKPRGGGGTRVSSVSQYIIDEHLQADCLLVLTDGYVEDTIKWDTTIPTLWLSTHRTDMPIPKGIMVNVK